MNDLIFPLLLVVVASLELPGIAQRDFLRAPLGLRQFPAGAALRPEINLRSTEGLHNEDKGNG